jgi:hypothetical protein
VTYTQLEQTRGNTHTNGAHKYKKKTTYRHINMANTYINNTSLHTADKNNNNNNITPIFIGLNKTIQVSDIKTTTNIQHL